MKELHLPAKLADLQEANYHNTLVLHALLEVLIARGFLTLDELTSQVREMDSRLTLQLESIAALSDQLLARLDKPANPS